MSSAIPLGSTVLVTGINGYVGSHVVDQLLLAGYKVRGTVRDPQKVAGLVALWEKKYGKDRLEVLTVKNMAVAGAFDEAVKGVSGIAHVASNLSRSSDPHDVIPEVLAGVRSIIDSAISSPSVKRFVYTSSGTATSAPLHDTAVEFTADDWNEEAIKQAWAPPPYTDERGYIVYFASKAEAEKLLFAYAKEKNVTFNVASVVPSVIIGKVLDRNIPASSGDFVANFLEGKPSALNYILPYWLVDVQDIALLHVAALINPGVKTERIFGFSEVIGFEGIASAARKFLPGREIPQVVVDGKKDLTKYPLERGAELLRALGRPGWTPVEESLRLNLEGL